MRDWILRVLGIAQIVQEKKKTNEILAEILRELKRNSDLIERYNKSYNI